MLRATTGIIVLAVAIIAAGGGASPVDAGGGCHSESFSDTTGTAVDLSRNCFNPTVIRVDDGGTVIWTNRDDGVLHTVTGAEGSFGDYTEFAGGESRSFTFEESGVFPYFCVLHPSMVGAVVVGSGAASDASQVGATTGSSDSSGRDGFGIASIAAAIAALGMGGLAAGVVGSHALSTRRRESRGL